MARMMANAMAVCILLPACAQDDSASSVRPDDASAERGKQLIRKYGCGSCHTIPGIRTAHGRVGPPLTFFADRTYIAGHLPNTPDNLKAWLLDPLAINPRTAMPQLDLSDSDARDVAAYLLTLR